MRCLLFLLLHIRILIVLALPCVILLQEGQVAEKEGQGVVSFQRFIEHRLSRCSQSELAQLVLSYPACNYSPLMVRSRTKDQLISYLIRSDQVLSLTWRVENEEA